ncbi:MAG: Hpt domain-containing protein [Clostridia bacterium]|nr:Hpt domain-containing protein [Clostridia bacterium]
MLTLDGIRSLGANTDEGLARCLNNEAFYLRMVGMALQDKNFDELKGAVEGADSAAAFACAHALKGVLGNLSLTPLFDPAARLTEVLRGKTGPLPPEAAPLTAALFDALASFRALA